MKFALDSIFDNVNWVTAIIPLVVGVIFYVYIQWINMPPGPIGLPYLGYYPFFGQDYHLQLQSMTKKYGDVFYIRCTGQLYLYLGSTRAIREAFVTKSDYFAERPTRFSIMMDCFGGGMGFANGEEWKEMRKFFVQTLKDVGFGKRSQESLMGDFLENTVNTLRKTNGENFEALSFFTLICSKVSYSMLLSGKQVDENDIKTFIEAFAIATEAMIGRKTLLSGPLLKLMVHIHPEFRRYRRNKSLLNDILAKIIEEHEKDFDKDNIRNLVDCYINMRKELEEKGDPRYKLYTARFLQTTLMPFIGDGGFTIGFLIALVLQELHSRSEIQREVQREIDNTVGRSRFPSWDDRNRMPYTNAVIQECFRKIDFFPIFPSLECTKETTVGGFHVPKGVVTLVGKWASYHDPDVYVEPEKFDPTRFLPQHDEQKSKAELIMFFGAGRRSCIGEIIVVMETFLLVTTILQNFDLHPSKESEFVKANSLPKRKEIDDVSVLFRATPRAY